jgi:hypothetical protein
MVINSLGTRLNKAIDKVGLPDVIGDVAGAQLDLATFNLAGAAQNWKDAFSGLETSSFLSPRDALARSRQVSGGSYAQGSTGTLATALQKMDSELMDLMKTVGSKVGSLVNQQRNTQDSVEDLVGPNAPIEDRIAAFLFKQMAESDKALEEQMRKCEALGDSAKKKTSGFLGSIKSAFKSVASTAFSIGGGALGGIIGGPIGSKLGSAFGGGLGGGLFGKQKTNNKENSRSVMNFKIQMLMNKRKELHDLVSNVLKTMHDMSMTAVRNIR